MSSALHFPVWEILENQNTRPKQSKVVWHTNTIPLSAPRESWVPVVLAAPRPSFSGLRPAPAREPPLFFAAGMSSGGSVAFFCCLQAWAPPSRRRAWRSHGRQGRYKCILRWLRLVAAHGGHNQKPHIPLSHTTYHTNAQTIKISPHTSMIPGNVRHCTSSGGPQQTWAI